MLTPCCGVCQEYQGAIRTALRLAVRLRHRDRFDVASDLAGRSQLIPRLVGEGGDTSNPKEMDKDMDTKSIATVAGAAAAGGVLAFAGLSLANAATGPATPRSPSAVLPPGSMAPTALWGWAGPA